MSASPTTIESSIKYLKRDEKFKSEKPFKVTFDTSHIPGGQKSNHEFVDVAVLMTDVRPNMSGFTLDKNGFQFCKLPTSLSHQDFLDDEAITSRHYAEVKGFVESLFPEGSEVVILGHRRRERGPNFPLSGAYNIPLPNPVVYPHGDFTADGARVRLEPVMAERPELKGRRAQMLNVWRVIRGPNQDWPLACCDYLSLNVKEDVEPSDVVHRNHVGENSMLLPNPNHRWYFMDNQEVDEVIVFRHCDSAGDHIPFSPHVAFDRAAGLSDVIPRQSIETKIACFLPVGA